MEMICIRLAVTLALGILASAVYGSDQAAPRNLVSNPGFESDENGDAFPDDWFLAGTKAHHPDWRTSRAKGKASLSPDAHSGARSVLYTSPTPYDWRRDEVAGRWDHTMWQKARDKPGSKYYYSVPIVSKDFAIEYANVYKVSAWVKAENVAGLHVKFMGVSPKGSPRWFAPALRTPEGFTTKTGSWDWEKWETVVIANRGTGWKGRIEAWMRENMTDGRFWIDDVTVEEADHAGRGIHAPLCGAGRVPGRIFDADRRIPAGGKRTIQRAGSTITISFANGTAVVFRTSKTDGGIGIGEVSVQGKRLRRATPPVQPLIETESGGRYSKCRYVGYTENESEVVIRTELIEKGTGAVDTLNWILAPALLEVYGRQYVGFKYSYGFKSKTNRAVAIVDRATWELDGTVDGLLLDTPNKPQVASVEKGTGLVLTPCIPFLRTPCFDFQTREGGLLVGFFDRIGHIETWMEKRSGEDRMLHFARHYFTSARQVRTVSRCVVFSPCGKLDPLRIIDEQTWALDAIENRYRREVGLKESLLLPTVRLQPAGEREGRFDKCVPLLPVVERLGFQVAMLNPMWESLDRDGDPEPGTCSIIGLEVAKAFGGEAGLKQLADTAHARGMKLITWAPTALNRRDSKLLRDHPEWICRLPTGKPRNYGSAGSYASGHELTHVSLASDYLDYSLRRYRHFHESIGLDGFWQDSFQAAGKLTYSNPTCFASYLKKAFERQTRLQQIGYTILNIEGYGPFGNNSPSPRLLAFGGRDDYKTSRYYYLVLGPDTYYRCIANKAMPIVPYADSTHPYWVDRSVANNPYFQAEASQANQDYASIRTKMKRCFLIPSKENPWQEIGVLWRDDETEAEVLFAYGDFLWQVGEDRRVHDVTTSKAVELTQGLLNTVARHTYLSTKR
jgi:hypothetical protein